jgi:NAD(P)-dependent dehydrogenase (short-subunit alcohol dehydrogenase family)
MGNLLKGKIAIITGGGRGIGRAIAECYAGEECNLVLISRTLLELQETESLIRKNYNCSIQIHAADISDEKMMDKIFNRTYKEFGKIDILVNAASVLGPAGSLEEINSEQWEKTIRINIHGLFFCIKAVLPFMKEQNDGCIINFSGGGGLLPNPFFDAYSVCKSATVRLTENLALELNNYNISICAIAPSGVNTRMFEDMMAAGREKVGEKIWESFEKRKKNGGDPIENPQKLALYIAVHRGKELNGRTISAKYDNLQKIEEHSEEIISSDIYTLRRIMPKDRGLLW